MSFINSMEKVLNEDFNNSVTENGAVGYRTTGTALLDFNFKVSSYRNKRELDIIEDFMKVFYEDKVTAMKFLFFIRDREEGLGERRLFRVIINYLATAETDIVKAVAPVIAEYGRWDDLLELFDTPLEEYTINDIITKQLDQDATNYKAGKPISLLAKWLPSINATSEKTKARAKKILKYSKVTEKEYRKMLSVLRKYIDVTERKMCANEWDKIVYEGVPSRANLNYNDAFLRHDEARRREFLGQVQKGEKKINAGKLYPHDIVHKYTGGSRYERKPLDATIEALWKALPKKEIANTLVVADGSGSMTSTIGKTNITALDVANALAIYFAEHNKGEFYNQYITFSENPQLVKFNKTDSLRDKIFKCFAYNEVANTNIEKVFGLILKTAIDNNLTQEEMPKNILIISDMEFDSCAVCGMATGGYYRNFKAPDKKLFQVIEKAYKEHGYKLPKLIFWNVNSRTGTIPMKENDLGVALVSGFSTNIAEMVMNDKLDPLEILLDKLNTKRYEKIGKIIKKVL